MAPNKPSKRTMPRNSPQKYPSPSAAAIQPKPYEPMTRFVPVPSQSTVRKNVMRGRTVPLVLGLCTSAVIAYYISTVYIGHRNDREYSATLNIPADPSARYNTTFTTYDADIESLEWIMGIKRLRAQLCAKATGHVLESAAGTGRNAAYFPLDEGNIKSVTMVDKCRFMLDQARSKWPKAGNSWFIKTSFRCLDLVNEPVPRPTDSESKDSAQLEGVSSQFGGFDTAIQTMGVCSTGEPAKLLRNLGKAVAGSQEEKGGKILLLEHGRSHYNFLNNIIDGIAPAHAERHGCWFNRDVGKIINESGLDIVEEKRFHFGTTWWFVCKPSKEIVAEQMAEAHERDTASVHAKSYANEKPWWRPF